MSGIIYVIYGLLHKDVVDNISLCMHISSFCSCVFYRFKPRLLFSRAGYASWGLSLSSVYLKWVPGNSTFRITHMVNLVDRAVVATVPLIVFRRQNNCNDVNIKLFTCQLFIGFIKKINGITFYWYTFIKYIVNMLIIFVIIHMEIKYHIYSN